MGGKKGRKKQKIGNSRRQDQGTRMNRERLLISKREKEKGRNKRMPHRTARKNKTDLRERERERMYI